MDLYEDDVLLENNKETKRVFLKHPGASAIVALTKDNKLILTKQFRYPIDQVSIEIPAGKKDHNNEDFLLCAKRELEEETGYQSDNFKHVLTFNPCVGYSDEVIKIFLATNCYKVLNPKPMDEDEFIDILIVSKEEVKKLLSDGLIIDGKTIIAVQYFLMNF